MSEAPTIQSLAAEAAACFCYGGRTNDREEFTKLRDGAPEWVRDLVYAAHGGMFPDDWRYDCISAALDYIGENGENGEDDSAEFADGQVDVYNGERIEWLASGGRQSYVDDAVENFGHSEQGVLGDIGAGQYEEAGEVYGLVLQALTERLEELEAALTV